MLHRDYRSGNAYDDEQSAADMDPVLLGQIRDYLGRNLAISVNCSLGQVEVTLSLEGVRVSHDSIDIK